MDFDKSFSLLIGNEGRYSNDRRDRGNWTSGKIGVGELKGTMYGISAMSYPHLDIKNITLEQAKEIYLNDYWNKCHIDIIPESSKFDVFDTAVNSGVQRAIILLQRALEVDDDGIIGKNTIEAINNCDKFNLDKKFNGHRLLFVSSLKIWPEYGKGLIIRIANNLIND